MNLSALIGPVDFNSALVLIVISIAICVVVTTLISRRRSRQDVSNDFELAKIKLANDDAANDRQQKRQHEFDLGKLMNSKEIEIRRIDSGMIEGTKAVNS